MMTRKHFIALADAIADEFCELDIKHQTDEVREALLTVAQTVCVTNPRFCMTRFLDHIEARIIKIKCDNGEMSLS